MMDRGVSYVGDLISARKWWLVLLAGLFFQPGMVSAVVTEYDQTLELFVGQTEIIAYKNVKRVSIGNGRLADVKVLKDAGQILLIAKEPGITDLRVWLKSGKQLRHLLRILTTPPEEVLSQVRSHLEDVEGVFARLAGDTVVIEGKSLREDDMGRVQEIVKQFPGVASYVTAGGVTLKGMIYFDVKMVEVRKSEIKSIGVDWADVINGPTGGVMADWSTNSVFRGTDVPPGSLINSVFQETGLPLDIGSNNPFFGISTSITSMINLLSTSGDARTLAEPKLTCRSGGQAEFLAGGEIPIPIIDQNGATSVTFKEFGIILRIAPISDPDGYILTRVEVEVSAPDFVNDVQGFPSFSSRKAETDMNLREGQTMVIAGLMNSENSKNVDKVPGLGSIPILGELFKSRDFNDAETDLVVMVTPHLIDPEHRINKELLRQAQTLRDESARDVRFSLMD